MVLNSRVIFYAFVFLFVDQIFANDDAGSFTDLANLGQLPEIYRSIVTDIQTLKLPAAPAKHFDVNSFTPFCNNFTVPKDIPEIDAECLRWEVSHPKTLRVGFHLRQYKQCTNTKIVRCCCVLVWAGTRT